MKVLTIILICICIVSLLLPLVVIGISGYMQNYYKEAALDTSKTNEEIRELLAKKKAWADISEAGDFMKTILSIIIFLVVGVIAILTENWLDKIPDKNWMVVASKIAIALFLIIGSAWFLKRIFQI